MRLITSIYQDLQEDRLEIQLVAINKYLREAIVHRSSI